MDKGHSAFRDIHNAYTVALSLTGKLEQDYFVGNLDESQQTILSGCYSVVAFFANLIAKWDLEEETTVISAPDINNAAASMREYMVELEDNLCDDRCPGTIDYRKVQALVGLRAVCQHIESHIGKS